MNVENIKFRGKRKDNGEWVYGDLIHYDNNDIRILEPNQRLRDIEEASYEVIPETVGRYMGKKEEGDEEIYEGDILGEGDEVFAVVLYDNKLKKFGLLYPDYSEISRDIVPDMYYYWRYRNWGVIGNIYDNPELLRGNNQ